ncbi:phosphotransferase [Streptomyces winkii]|uniref:phosphotransferase n=1 Tax=Streptomyces winkii TaxID=3051178 RepID=UPI0028D0E585|nr:phosphotransferase [Streptomyces sp. DSM 40971]
MAEFGMPGGFINRVVRVGATVRRPLPARAEFAHDLLGLFEQQGWTGAPRFRGLDEQGREILDYMEGYVGWGSVRWSAVRSDACLTGVARLVREFHDLTAGSALAGAHEVVCHNDLSPKNTVYAPVEARLRPVALIDWDLAAPGERIHDVAHLCWQYLALGSGVTDVKATALKMRTICDAYGLSTRATLVDTILWWQDRCWRGIEAAASEGDPAMVDLRDKGAAESVRAAHRWVAAHRGELQAAL